MVYIYLLFILLNTSSAIAIYSNKKVEETIFISIGIKVLLLFLSGIFLNLEIGFYFILILNLALLFYNAFSIYKKPNILKENIMTTGFYILLFTSILFIWINYNREVTIWDEFSHWALVVKNMFHLNNFGIGPDSTVLAKSYLSGTSLFQYFCMKLNGSFNESILYFGINIMSFSLILPIFKIFKGFRNISIYLIYFSLLLIPTWFYYSYYSSLYVDAILGVTFVYALYMYYSNYEEGLNRFNITNLSISLMMLIFIKDFGIVLAFILFIIVLVDNLFLRNKFTFKLNYIWKNTRYLFLSLIPFVLVKLIWIIYLNANSITSTAGNSLLSTIFNLLSFNIEGYKIDVIIRFIKAIISQGLINFNISGSFAIIMFVFTILSYFLINSFKDKKQKNIYSFLFLSLLIGAIIYSGLLLISYLSLFGEYESLRLASYQRYISTYALSMILLIFMLLVKKYFNNIKELNRLSIICFVIILMVTNVRVMANMTLLARSEVNITIETRKSYKNFRIKVDKYMNKDDRLYFISTNDNGIDFYIARYELTPNKMNLSYAWSIGDPYNADDIWTYPITKEQWALDLINNYDYVYLFDIDKQFISKYETLFIDNIKDNRLYKVEKNIGNERFLKLVN